ncbi:zinc finger and BTB domain-containing protein 9-like [Aplochiton taeniatus]
MELLCFRLPCHGDTVLKHMNLLRNHQNFCDITIVASDNQTFKGHKVVLAACSPFLRDQFLLNPSSRLQVSVLHSSTVVCDLLQSCYTGVLEFSPKEIVNYLTAASYLQMEHVVERCRGALKKYMQPRNPTPPPRTIKSEENQSTPVIVSGSIRSTSPSMGHSSSVQPHSPLGHSMDESYSDAQSQTANKERCKGSPTKDEPSVSVDVSDEENQARPEDYDVFTLYIPEEEEQQRSGSRPDPQGVDGESPSETDSAMADRAESELNASVFTREGLYISRRRPAMTRGRARGRGRGRGFKRKKWMSYQDRRPGSVSNLEDWPMPTAGELMSHGLGIDFCQESVGAGYFPGELPRLDYGMGEAHGADGEVTPRDGGGAVHYSLDDPTRGPNLGMGTEGGDESVAVVGSTSSMAGPVICEHCGLTFPSAQSLTIHTHTSHLLYSCLCCNKHFQHANHLKRHMAVHRGSTGAKGHECPLCYKTFTQKSTLIDHMNLHSGERPHRCAYCNARFAHKPALRRHLKEQHGKTTGQNSLYEQEEMERERAQAGVGIGGGTTTTTTTEGQP